MALIDDHVIDAWTLVSYTPFTLRNVLLKVGSSGPHTLKFVGTTAGDHTAFLSGFTIEAVGLQTNQSKRASAMLDATRW